MFAGPRILQYRRWESVVLETQCNARSTLDPMYDKRCPHRIADKSNCDLRPEWVTIFVSTPQRFTFSSRENIHAPSDVYQRKTTTIVTSYVKRHSILARWLAEAFHVIPWGDLRLLRFATNLSTLPINDFYDSTGERSKYRKSLTYKVCDAVHTRPPHIARPVYVNVSKFLPIYVLVRYGVDRA